MLQSKKIILFCLFMVLGLVACQKEVLVDSDTNFVGQEASKACPSKEFMISTYGSSMSLTDPIACKFQVCPALPSGLEIFKTVADLNSYIATGYVGHTYCGEMLWFAKQQNYLLIPEGTFPIKALNINYGAAYSISNMPTITYNKVTKQWVVTGGANYTATVITYNSAADLPC